MGHSLCKLATLGWKKDMKIIIFGLDAAGKTTILYILTQGEVVTTIPTIGFNVEHFTHKNISIAAWDVGGRDKVRSLYRHYFPGASALMFVIDSTDQDRLEEMADEVKRLVMEPELGEAVILLLANKQDLGSAMSVEEIKEKMNYNKLCEQRPSGKKMNIFGCSAVMPEGQGDLLKALDWLSEELVPKSGYWFQSWYSSETGKTKDKTNKAPSQEGSDSDKKPWTFSSYVKGTVTTFKSLLPRLW
ncbi:uncharacterized protein [Haliotis cracherodii]|uniref:uncharacterized protein n=1 Tax=Haliotis cracherodii TaxID=6455 RepID=UPI0039EB36C9